MEIEVLNKIYYQDIIIKKGIFLGLKSKSDERINFQEDNNFYSKVLPNDLIEYSINKNNLVVINKILKREPFYSIGIVSSYEDKKFFHKFEVFTPLLQTNYKLVLKYGHKKYDIGDRILLYFNDLDSNNNLKVEDVLKLKHIYDRKSDKNILINLYSKIKDNNLDNIKINIKDTNINYYTKEGVINLTHLNTFNIDPIHSKDFDDAISIDLEKNKIYIHIVDINQIEINSNIDKKAAYLGYTLYLSEGNHNMLNTLLSENKFSLIKDEERKVITIELDIDTKGEPYENAPKILKYNIYKSIIKVKDRFDYENVEKEDILNTRKDIKYLYDLTEKIYKRPISIPHPKYIINENGKIEKIEIENNSSISHKMIEMLMILTNKIVTEHLNKLVKIPERYHQKTENLDLNIFDVSRTHLYTQSSSKDENIEISEALNKIIKLKTAVYDTQKTSHFALQLNNYCHFTSPIRRYFDIIIHRILGGFQYEKLDELIEHLNKREEFNEKIVDLYNNWKLIDYLIDHPTKEFEAKIIKVNKNGIKFYIKELCYNGFIICRNILENIYWKYFPDEKMLKGKNYVLQENNIIFVNVNNFDYLSHESISWRIINL